MACTAQVPSGRRPGAKQFTLDGASATEWLSRASRVWAVKTLVLLLTASHRAAVAMNGLVAHRAVAQASNRVAAFAEKASKRFAVPVNWVSSVANIESAGQVYVRWPISAMGLMQITPAIRAEIHLRCDPGHERFDRR